MKTHKCPHCGRNLTESELYCYFCESEIPELRKERKEKAKKQSTESSNKTSLQII